MVGQGHFDSLRMNNWYEHRLRPFDKLRANDGGAGPSVSSGRVGFFHLLPIRRILEPEGALQAGGAPVRAHDRHFEVLRAQQVASDAANVVDGDAVDALCHVVDA